MTEQLVLGGGCQHSREQRGCPAAVGFQAILCEDDENIQLLAQRTRAAAVLGEGEGKEMALIEKEDMEVLGLVPFLP